MSSTRIRCFSPSLASLAGAFVLLLGSSDASAFVRSRTTKGCNPVHWDQTCLHVAADSRSVPDVSSAEVDRIVGLAIDSWRDSTGSATFLDLVYVGASERETVSDGWQVIKFRSASWCRPAEEPGGEEICYDASAVAITTLSYVSDLGDPSADGRIIDADIELNAVANLFVDLDKAELPPAGGRKVVDLWNTLTHELGHLQGLEHTCRLGTSDGIPACTRDSNDEPLLDCKTVDQGRAGDPTLEQRYEASMYPKADSGETRKRQPKEDDVAGIVVAYPVAADPRICAMPGDAPPVPTEVGAKADPAPASAANAGGCHVTRGADGADGAGLAAYFAVAAGALRRRRRRAGPE